MHQLQQHRECQIGAQNEENPGDDRTRADCVEWEEEKSGQCETQQIFRCEGIRISG